MPSTLTRCANGRLSCEGQYAEASELYTLVDDLQRLFRLADVSLPRVGLDAIVIEGTIDGQPVVIGYDNWSGCYVMAMSEAADAIVSDIAAHYSSLPAGAPPAQETPPAGKTPAPAGGEKRRKAVQATRPTRKPTGVKPPHEALREAALFKRTSGDAEHREELVRALIDSKRTCRADPEKRRFRRAVLGALAGIARAHADAVLAVLNLDLILNAISRTSYEDITGYHHAFDVEALLRTIQASASVEELLKTLVAGTGRGYRKRPR